MSYTYNIDPKAMFEDRSKQFVLFGIPKADVEALQAIITDTWTDEPGGWTLKWSVFARRYMEAGNPLLSSLAYGFAKFPCLANDTRRRAFQNQVAAYLAATPNFPVNFERRTISLFYRDELLELPVHLFSESGGVCQQTGAPVGFWYL